MMDVLTAFREFAPPTADPRSVARTTECAETLAAALAMLARKCVELRVLQQDELAISDQLFKLYNQGPRGVRAGDPATEDAVRAYLHTMLKNWSISRLRKRKNETPVDLLFGADELTDPHDPLGLLDRREHEALVERLATQLFDEIIPTVAAMPPASPDLVTTMQQLRAAVRDQVQVDQIARDLLSATPQPMTEVETLAVRQRGLPLDQHSAALIAGQGIAWAPAALAALPSCTDDGACCQNLERLRLALLDAQVARVRVNLDARFQRGRKRLLNGIQKLREQGRLDPERAAQLELAVHAHLRFYH